MLCVSTAWHYGHGPWNCCCCLSNSRQVWGQLPGFPLVNEVISANDNELEHPCLACSLVCFSYLHSCQEGNWIPVMTELMHSKNLGLCLITEVCREGKD